MNINRLIILAFSAFSGYVLAADSDLDTTFGVNLAGYTMVSPNQGGTNVDNASDLLVGPNGKLYVVGNATVANPAQRRVVLIRLNPNGTPDGSFGMNGVIAAPVGLSDNFIVKAATFDADGNLLVAGAKIFQGADTDFMLCKFSPDGVGVPFSFTATFCVETAFDMGGDFADVVRDLIVMQDGRIVLIGSANGDDNREYGVMAVVKASGEFANSPIILPDDYAALGFNSVVDLPQFLPSLVGIVGYRRLMNDPFRFENFFLSVDIDAEPGSEVLSNGVYKPTPNGSSQLSDFVLSDDVLPIAVGSLSLDGLVYGYLAANEQEPILFSAGTGVTLFERIVRLPGSRVAVLGTRISNNNREAIVARFRYNRAACAFEADTAFAPNGFTVVNPGVSPPLLQEFSPRGLVAQDGRILLAATLDQSGGDYDIGVARLGGDTIFIDGFDDLDLLNCD